MARDEATAGQFYFNISTGEVEEGKVSTWNDRMGPYPTRAEAEQALAKAAGRNAVWDGDDEAWSADGNDWKRDDWNRDERKPDERSLGDPTGDEKAPEHAEELEAEADGA